MYSALASSTIVDFVATHQLVTISAVVHMMKVTITSLERWKGRGKAGRQWGLAGVNAVFQVSVKGLGSRLLARFGAPLPELSACHVDCAILQCYVHVGFSIYKVTCSNGHGGPVKSCKIA